MASEKETINKLREILPGNRLKGSENERLSIAENLTKMYRRALIKPDSSIDATNLTDSLSSIYKIEDDANSLSFSEIAPLFERSLKNFPDRMRDNWTDYIPLQYSNSRTEYNSQNTLLWITYFENRFEEKDWLSGDNVSERISLLKDVNSILESMFQDVMDTKLVLSRFSCFENNILPEERINEFFIFARFIKLWSTFNAKVPLEKDIHFRELGAHYINELNPEQVFSNLEHMLQLVSEPNSERILSLRYCLALEINHFSPTLGTFDHLLNMYERYKSKEPRNPKVHFFHPATYAFNKSDGFAMFLSMSHLATTHKLVDGRKRLIQRVKKFTYRNDLNFTVSPLEKGEKFIPSLQSALRWSYSNLLQRSKNSISRESINPGSNLAIGDQKTLLDLLRQIEHYTQILKNPEGLGMNQIDSARFYCFQTLFFSQQEKQQWLGKLEAKSLDRKVVSLLGDLSLNNPLNSSHQSLASFVTSKTDKTNVLDQDFSFEHHQDVILCNLDMCMLNLIRSESENNRFTGLNSFEEINSGLSHSSENEIVSDSLGNTNAIHSLNRHRAAEKILSQHFKTILLTETEKNTLSRTNKVSRLGVFARVLMTMEILIVQKSTKFKELGRLTQPIRLHMKGVNKDSPNGLKINIILHRYLELVRQIKDIHSLLDKMRLGTEFGSAALFHNENRKLSTLLTSLSVLASMDLCLLHYVASHIEPNHHESNYILRKTMEQLDSVDGSVGSFCSDYPCSEAKSASEAQKAFTFENEYDLFYRPQSLRSAQKDVTSVKGDVHSMPKKQAESTVNQSASTYFSPQNLFEVLKSHCFPVGFEELNPDRQNQHRVFVSRIEQFLNNSDPRLSELNDLLSELKKHYHRHSAKLGIN